MTAALTPALSWLVGGAVVGFAVVVYVYVVGSSWLDAAGRELDRLARADRDADRHDGADLTWTPLGGGVYDHQARGDFE